MNCEILSTLYIKSNGDILCNDDYGERVKLYTLTDENFTFESIFSSDLYQQIRFHFKQQNIPWDNICNRCAFLRPHEDFTDNLTHKIIHKIQIEPSLACALRCPGCSQKNQIKNRDGDKLMPVLLYRNILTRLKDENYIVKSIEYCGQGEPLTHRQFKDLVSLARLIFPSAYQRLITNGNHDFQKCVGDSHLDEIIISCDGYYQESYEKYRIGGNIKAVFKFLENAVTSKSAYPKSIIWKYILFEFNDSDNEIIQANNKSIEISVDSLLFVITTSLFFSKKYSSENLFEILLLAPNSSINTIPILEKHKRQISLVSTKKSRSRLLTYHIDVAYLLYDNVLHLKGWAFCKTFAKPTHLKKISVFADNEKIGDAILKIKRTDVKAAFGKLDSDTVGFIFSAKLASKNTELTHLIIKFYGYNYLQFTEKFEITYIS